MMKLLATAHVMGLQLAETTRTKLATRSERGSVSLEQVVIGAALLALAIALVAIIRSAVMNRAGSIT